MGEFITSTMAKLAFEFFRFIARELRPSVGAGHDRFQVAHHLAAIVDTEAEAVGTGEEVRELVGKATLNRPYHFPPSAYTARIQRIVRVIDNKASAHSKTNCEHA